MYFGIRVQLNEFFAPWGLETTYVDMSDLNAVRAAMRPETKLVILESPTNPDDSVGGYRRDRGYRARI